MLWDWLLQHQAISAKILTPSSNITHLSLDATGQDKIKYNNHVRRGTILVALKALSDGEELENFLDKPNRDFFEKTLAGEKLALTAAITQKILGATKHRTVKEEEATNSRTETSSTHHDIKKLLASSK
ncbi:hypothetical protein Trydic_g13833 [Trypoxylus dichotomus]